jgi:transcription antitermination factor NusG
MEEEVVLKREPRKIWTPVRTKPRQEKKVHQYCQGKNISSYLPLVKRIHKYGKRRREFDIPMFPGYIFCQINDSDYQELVLSNGILFRVNMDTYDEATLIKELEAVVAFEELSARQKIVVKPELVCGSTVEIKSGPLRGLEGIVEKRKNTAVLSININILGQSASVELDAEDLQAID